MHADEVKAIFDQQAAHYDAQWVKTAPVREGLLFLLQSVFADLPEDANVLCVGVGTGEEMLYLARRFPRWRFTALDPSDAMIAVCRSKVEREGIASRCQFHSGYLETLPNREPYDAATCFLVSQFILDPEARADFFRGIAARLKPDALLASSDLASDVTSPEYERLLPVWFKLMAGAGLTPEALRRMREAYARDVAVLTPERVASLITAGGFDMPVRFYQAGLIHAWFARRLHDLSAR